MDSPPGMIRPWHEASWVGVRTGIAMRGDSAEEREERRARCSAKEPWRALGGGRGRGQGRGVWRDGGAEGGVSRGKRGASPSLRASGPLRSTWRGDSQDTDAQRSELGGRHGTTVRTRIS